MRLKIDRPEWKFVIATTLTALSVVLPIWLWSIDNSPKSLNLAITGGFPITSSAMKTSEDIIVLYQGQKVEQPYSSIIELMNAGTKSIYANDFDGDIEIKLAKPSRLLRTQVIRREPESLDPLIKTKDDRILLSPLLLNPSDKITVEILSDGSTPEFIARARVAGVKDIRIENQNRKRTLFPRDRGWLWIFPVLASFSVFFISRIGMNFSMKIPPSKQMFRAGFFSIVSSSGFFMGIIIDQVYGKTGIGYFAWGVACLLVGGAIHYLILLLYPEKL